MKKIHFKTEKKIEELHAGKMGCIQSLNYGIYEKIHNYDAINFAFLRNFFIIFFKNKQKKNKMM